MSIFFDFFYFLFSIFYLPYYFLIRRKWHDGFWMRFGRIPQNFRDELTGRKNIWIHAVSVGEVLAICDLVKELKQRHPGYDVVCSVVTPTGYKLAGSKLHGEARVIFAPLDFSWIVNRFIRMIRPVMYISAETELWPNLFLKLQAAGVPIVLINGRISDRSFRHYRYVRLMMRSILKNVDCFCMQGEEDARRICQLGAQKERVYVVGNLKYDLASASLDGKRYLADKGFRYWICGSTHPGEEEIVIRVYGELVKQFSDLRLVIAPRHVERKEDVRQIIAKQGFNPVVYSRYSAGNRIGQDEILLIDVIGVLRQLYAQADVVFVGKSLCGEGGQNMIEPAVFGKSVIVGPNTQNFRDVMTLLRQDRAIEIVGSEAQLKETLMRLLSNEPARREMGRRAADAMEKARGASKRTMELLDRFLRCEHGKE